MSPPGSGSTGLRKQVKYKDLNAAAEQVAAALVEAVANKHAAGAAATAAISQTNRVVGLLLSRGLQVACGIYGCLKAGLGYLPIDTEYYLTNQLSNPLTRIFEPIIDNPGSLLAGEHTRTVSKPTPVAKSKPGQARPSQASPG